jgi:pyruvate-ferredoxin/flavodoxin oxidoreductase
MTTANDQQKKAVDSGYWPLLRYDPRLVAEGKNPLQLDSKAPKIPLQDYIYNETRYTMLTKSDPQAAAMLLLEAQADVNSRWHLYEQLATLDYGAK